MRWKMGLVIFVLLLAACRTTFTRIDDTPESAPLVSATIPISATVLPEATAVVADDTDLGIVPATLAASGISPTADLIAAGCIDPVSGHASAACAAEQHILAGAQCIATSADSDAFNVRSGPGLDFDIVASGANLQLAVLGQSDTGWYQVDGLVQGWVFSGVVALQGQCEGLFAVSAPTDLGSCFRIGYGIGAPHSVYDGPSYSDSTIVGQIEAGVAVEVIGRSEERVQLRDLGWVNSGTGGLEGDCENVPLVHVRPAVPVGICSLYTGHSAIAAAPVYSDSSQGSGALVGQLPPGEYVEVLARGTLQGYRVRLPDGASGWAQVPEQVIFVTNALNGPCDNLPLEEEAVDLG